MDQFAEMENSQVGVIAVAKPSFEGTIRTHKTVLRPIPRPGAFLKRILDLLIAVPSLVLLTPLLTMLAAAIKLDSRGPALYESTRVGQHGKLFTCYKFRTMVENADQSKERLRQKNERRGATFKIALDP